MPAKSYTESMGPADFRIKYSWLLGEDGISYQLPFQHMRSDFSYDGDNVAETGVFMIWPEFQDSEGCPIHGVIPLNGEASMWIMNRAKYELYHWDRLQVGLRGYLMMGARRLAHVRVIELIRLLGE